MHHYILAACFWLLRPLDHSSPPVIATFSRLTVVLTYLIGRELSGWKLGACRCPAGHPAAAHRGQQPRRLAERHDAFYSTLAAYALLRALRAFPEPDPSRVPRWARWLMLAGFVFGLMLHTHIGTVVLAPALAGAVLLALCFSADRRAAFRRFFVSPWPYLTVLLVPLAYSPVIIDNARSGWAGYWRAQGRDYAYAQDPGLAASYLANLRDLLFELMRMSATPSASPSARCTT